MTQDLPRAFTCFLTPLVYYIWYIVHFYLTLTSGDLHNARLFSSSARLSQLGEVPLEIVCVCVSELICS